ncbi:O-linked N-acetylglucosamine transferase OGT [Phytophthora cinnamomi]|uniref:O-linked N-acetylglucosamine transferase OGT n=1 Tax=Phytophthora cinnamomi TaxID=4785 RepID=UPI00355ABFF0|nr:O-linked N-acetylglucosamine transferase OGT [Phytophthora cinnamomi]
MKMHPAFDDALAGILEQDDKAIIVLLASETQTVWTEQLRRRFRQRLDRNHRRVLVLPTLLFPEFQALLALADVLLDPFPFGGGVTTLDALHLGIPVVTLPSAQSVVHLAAGFLRYMNASYCIASSLDEYVDLAIQIATDHDDIRQRLLAHRSDIYQDVSTVDDWNTFLNTVTPVEQDRTPSQ